MGTPSPAVPAPRAARRRGGMFVPITATCCAWSPTTSGPDPQVIEDACAFAWLELIARQPERTSIIGWLRVVAWREAIRRRTASLDRRRADPPASGAGLRAAEAKDALRGVAPLPSRERAVLTLQVAGHSHREIGEQLAMTPRTVERRCCAPAPQSADSATHGHARRNGAVTGSGVDRRAWSRGSAPRPLDTSRGRHSPAGARGRCRRRPCALNDRNAALAGGGAEAAGSWPGGMFQCRFPRPSSACA
ncbi:MAG TPA: sigma-70 family RNA polymerase sigma factor [Solirubrobacteraceae bacterium]|nr:sigma-70 family RNA polymerase sigma factor [Solirubrobacteraceae bacterium]